MLSGLPRMDIDNQAVPENAYGDGSMAEEDRVRLTTTLESVFPSLLVRGVLRVELTAQENTRRA